MVQLNLVLGVVDDASTRSSLHGGLRFKPTSESTQTNRVKVLRPHLYPGRLLSQDGQIKGRSHRYESGGTISVRFHGLEQGFSLSS